MFLLFGIVSVFGSFFALINCIQNDWSMISIICLVSCITSICLYLKLASMEDSLKSLRKEFEEQKESFEHFKMINKQNIHTLKDRIDALNPVHPPEYQTEPINLSTTEPDNEETEN